MTGKIISSEEPIVSVLMPAYNAEKHIAHAIESILLQSFTNFELIVLNDGSTDETSQIIDQFKDVRICKVDLSHNQGLVKARNQLVGMARGRYIAFLDSDDIAMPNRLQVQVDFLESGKADICGGAHYSLYETSGKLKLSKQRYSDPDIRALITVCSPLCNPAVMGRAEVFKKHPYQTGKDYAEDYSLWAELALAGYCFANLKERLITYRIHASQISQAQNPGAKLIFSQSRMEYLEGLGISREYCPRPLTLLKRLQYAIPFMLKLNQKIRRVSVGANYEIYGRFQFRGLVSIKGGSLSIRA